MKNTKIYLENIKRKAGALSLVVVLGVTSFAVIGCTKKAEKVKDVDNLVSSIENNDETVLDDSITDEKLAELEKIKRYIEYSNEIYDKISETIKPTTGDGINISAYYSDNNKEAVKEELNLIKDYSEEDIKQAVKKLKKYDSKHKHEKISDEEYANYIEASNTLEALYATNYFLSTFGYGIEKNFLNDIYAGIIRDEFDMTIEEFDKNVEKVTVSEFEDIDKYNVINDHLEYYNNSYFSDELLNDKMGYNKTRNDYLTTGYEGISSLTENYIKKVNKKVRS